MGSTVIYQSLVYHITMQQTEISMLRVHVMYKNTNFSLFHVIIRRV